MKKSSKKLIKGLNKLSKRYEKVSKKKYKKEIKLLNDTVKELRYLKNVLDRYEKKNERTLLD